MSVSKASVLKSLIGRKVSIYEKATVITISIFAEPGADYVIKTVGDDVFLAEGQGGKTYYSIAHVMHINIR